MILVHLQLVNIYLSSDFVQDVSSGVMNAALVITIVMFVQPDSLSMKTNVYVMTEIIIMILILQHVLIESVEEIVRLVMAQIQMIALLVISHTTFGKVNVLRFVKMDYMLM